MQQIFTQNTQKCVYFKLSMEFSCVVHKTGAEFPYFKNRKTVTAPKGQLLVQYREPLLTQFLLKHHGEALNKLNPLSINLTKGVLAHLCTRTLRTFWRSWLLFQPTCYCGQILEVKSIIWLFTSENIKLFVYFCIYTYSTKQKSSTCWIVLSFLLREIASSFSRISFPQSSHSSLISVFCFQRTIIQLRFVLCQLLLNYKSL